MTQDQPTTREARAAVSRNIREALRTRGWSMDGLAKAAGRRKSSVVNLIAGGNASPDSRLRVELAMRAPFWTAPEVFVACLAVAGIYGGQHPRTLNLRQLDALAAKHLRPTGIRGRIRPRATLISKLEAHAIAR